MRLRTFILSVLLLGIFSAARAQTGNAPANAPKFFVRDYRFEGETILPPEKLSGILSNYTGTVDLPRIHAGLNKLQRFYELEGVTNLSVTLPQQTLTDGIVRVKIVPRPAQKNAALCHRAILACSPITPAPTSRFPNCAKASGNCSCVTANSDSRRSMYRCRNKNSPTASCT
jgi:hypothetical protein